MKQIEKKSSTVQRKKRNHKLWGILTLVAIYPLIYFIQKSSSKSGIYDILFYDFENGGLLLLLFLVPFGLFLFAFFKKDHTIIREFDHLLKVENDELNEYTKVHVYVQKKGSKTKVDEKENVSLLVKNLEEITDLIERRKTGTRKSQTMGIPVEGSGTIGDKTDAPLELITTTKTYDYKERSFVFKNGEEQVFFSHFTSEEIKKLLEI